MAGRDSSILVFFILPALSSNCENIQTPWTMSIPDRLIHLGCYTFWPILRLLHFHHFSLPDWKQTLAPILHMTLLKIFCSVRSKAGQEDNSKSQREIYFLLTQACCFELKRRYGDWMKRQARSVHGMVDTNLPWGTNLPLENITKLKFEMTTVYHFGGAMTFLTSCMELNIGRFTGIS